MSEHGEFVDYRRGCRCAACVEANRAYQRDWYRRRRAGSSLMVPAQEAARHVRLLLGTGMTASGIASIAGLSSPTVVLDVVHGHSKKLKRVNADAILGVGISSLPPGAKQWVPSHKVQPMVSELRRVLGNDDLERLLKVGGSAVFNQRWVQRVTVDRAILLVHYLARQGLVAASLLDEVKL